MHSCPREKNFGHEHTVGVRKRSRVRDGFRSDQSRPLSTLTHRLEQDNRS